MKKFIYFFSYFLLLEVLLEKLLPKKICKSQMTPQHSQRVGLIDTHQIGFIGYISAFRRAKKTLFVIGVGRGSYCNHVIHLNGLRLNFRS